MCFHSFRLHLSLSGSQKKKKKILYSKIKFDLEMFNIRKKGGGSGSEGKMLLLFCSRSRRKTKKKFIYDSRNMFTIPLMMTTEHWSPSEIFFSRLFSRGRFEVSKKKKISLTTFSKIRFLKGKKKKKQKQEYQNEIHISGFQHTI